MPWKETSVMEERLRFVAQLLEGEGMSDVCRAFGISRKTGYKIFNRYKDDGLEALTDRSRRPVRYANQLPEPVEAMRTSGSNRFTRSARWRPINSPASATLSVEQVG
nr:helix-turn-helix domain-containing protein [Rhizobium bangladeshense]